MNIAIIGAGASGLMLSSILTKNNIKHTIFNKGKIGRKILASGNGKCNISNINLKSEYYHDSEFYYIVKDYQSKLFEIFKSLDIYTYSDNEGRLYPKSNSSESILNILLKHATKNIVDIEVKSIKKVNNKYYINDYNEAFDKVVISTGTNANFKKNTVPSIAFLNDLKIKIKPFKPSLSGFKTSINLKDISGVRVKALTKLYNKNELIHEESGEVMFKDEGISGIVIMNQSSYFNHIKNYDKPYIILDMLYNEDYDNLESIFPPKLYKYILKNNINIHKFIIPIKDYYDMEFAQVATGGIEYKYMRENLSLKSDKNIFVTGEVLDIDGVCGGYNLMFAFTSAIKVGEELINEVSNK